MTQIDCTICGSMNEYIKCIIPSHICKWCRQPITESQIYDMFRNGEPHCLEQQEQKERPVMVKVELKWISATVNEIYSNDANEGIEELDEGQQVMLYNDGTWVKL